MGVDPASVIKVVIPAALRVKVPTMEFPLTVFVDDADGPVKPILMKVTVPVVLNVILLKVFPLTVVVKLVLNNEINVTAAVGDATV